MRRPGPPGAGGGDSGPATTLEAHASTILRCQCGACSANGSDNVWGVFVCHCSMCPAEHRSDAYWGGAPWAAVPRATWSGAAVKEQRSSAFGTRGVCSSCGDALYIRYDCESHTDWAHAGVFSSGVLDGARIDHIHCERELGHGIRCHKAFEPWVVDPCRPAGTPAPVVCLKCFQTECTCSSSLSDAASTAAPPPPSQEADDEECHLSEVHIRASSTPADSLCTTTEFIYRSPPGTRAELSSAHETANEPPPSAIDADGDMVLPRKPKRSRLTATPSDDRCGGHGGVLRIEHTLATPLRDVGLQVWRAALLTSEWLFASKHDVRGACVLDLGAGCGLTSIAAAAAGARTVFCTDHVHSVMANAQRNIHLNSSPAVQTVRVRNLPWNAAAADQLAALISGRDASDESADAVTSDVSWQAGDADALRRCTLLLAADCCYDDNATAALLRLVSRLMPMLPTGAVCIFALERRVNFCLEGMRPRAPAAEFFAASLEQRRAAGEWMVERMESDHVPRLFEDTERSAELEMWRVTCAVSKGE